MKKQFKKDVYDHVQQRQMEHYQPYDFIGMLEMNYMINELIILHMYFRK
jgi:hypothetical protein